MAVSGGISSIKRPSSHSWTRQRVETITPFPSTLIIFTNSIVPSTTTITNTTRHPKLLHGERLPAVTMQLNSILAATCLLGAVSLVNADADADPDFVVVTSSIEFPLTEFPLTFSEAYQVCSSSHLPALSRFPSSPPAISKKIANPFASSP